MPIGTARMASLCLPNSELHVGIDWSTNAALARALADPARPPILLYPATGARDILREPPLGPVTLVVVDGTWSQAKTVVRDNPILHALPRYAFATPEPSRYRIRREPRPEYCSTIEALMHVLGALEGDPARFRSLLDPLNAMVEAQLACQAERPQRRKRVPPMRPSLRERLPAALRERFGDLVLVVAEANAWPYRDKSKLPDELVQIAAFRPATGEQFEVIVAPVDVLSASTPFHTGLAAETIRGGVARSDALAAFARFVHPTDVLASWGHYAPDLIRDSGGTVPERLDLRASAQRLLNQRAGSLEDFAAKLESPATPALAQGRAGLRLAALAKLVATWRAL